MTVATRLKPAAQEVFPDWPMSWGVRPKFVTLARPERPTFGPAIARVAGRLGGELFPWQEYFTAVATEQVPDGLGGWEPAYDTVVALVTRRGGKTFLVKSVGTERGLRSSSAKVAYTAQTRDAAKDRWREICDQPADVAAERGLLQVLGSSQVHVTSGVGNEVLTFRSTGSEFFPFAPNEKAGHGGGWDLVFVDELWAHSLVVKQLIQQAYRPMWSVKPGQEWLLSAGGTRLSSWLHDVRRRGRASVNDPVSRIAYIEFGWPEDVDVRSVSDEELKRLAVVHHPRRGRGLREGFVRGDFEELGRAGFIRAYGNVDAEDDAGGVLSAEVLRAQTARVRIPDGAACSVGLALDDQRRESTVALAWRSSDGSVVVEDITRPGVRWAAAYVAALSGLANLAVANSRLGRGAADEVERVWADPASGLDARPVLRVSQADMVAACGQWMAGVEESHQVFFGGSSALRAGLASADLPVGGQWVSRDGEPITAVQAHALAVWAVEHGPEPVQRRGFWLV